MDTNMDTNIITTEYSEEMQKSFINYAMSVIVARALPDVRDGLKPVQRGTLYDMHVLASVMTDHIENVPELSVIPWVNTTRTATVPSMKH